MQQKNGGLRNESLARLCTDGTRRIFDFLGQDLGVRMLPTLTQLSAEIAYFQRQRHSVSKVKLNIVYTFLRLHPFQREISLKLH